jgi:hypothetical protein
MSQPVLEVADIFRAWAGRYIERSGARISWPQHKVMRAIERCRTAALGRHRDRCTGCGKDFGFSFNSCRNRHCPKCQTQARNRWVAARTGELVPLEYFHVVFTVPHQLSELMLQNKRLLYNLLFRCVAATLLEVAANPKRLGAEIGFLCVLHTWGQTLMHHPHIHCVVPAGGFAPGRTRWIKPKSAGFFLPTEVLSEVFRGKFTEALKRPFPPEEARLSRIIGVAGGAAFLRTFPAYTPQPQVGRICEEALRRTGARAALSGKVHPSGRHLEPPADQHGRRQGHVSLERLCARWQEAKDDLGGRRVHSPFPAARASQGPGAHSPLRLDGESLPPATGRVMSRAAWCGADQASTAG